MALVNKAVSAVSRPAVDVVLAKEAASQLKDSFPRKPRRKIVSDVLARLAKKRAEREAMGLNHWNEHASIALEVILQEIAEEVEARREAQAEFLKANRSKALVFAYAAFKSRQEAEDVVAQTDVEYLEGKTDEKHYFRALKLNIINRQRRLAFERGTFEAAGNCGDSEQLLAEELAADGAASLPSECRSSRIDDQDPLDILIAREEEEAMPLALDLARHIAETEREYWWIRQKEWGKELGIGQGSDAAVVNDRGTSRE